ncbi:HKD family nuclease [Flaviramulus basaltis]|uniref:HKD family nuclease n=1 Tax=Flaviramulus basaltis TaxID=369401 RepID=A0A1K2IRA5_9FLAO|nr:phospholipase D family protein [Flaviramulus basaltis]SFZ94903.1 HKD family nuclease [Flaviramulus basaltis]
MKATFLGHGLDSGDKNNVGKQIVTSLESKDYKIFNGFVAFASISGVKMLQPYLKKAKSKYDHIRFYIGVDNRGTSKEALESLLNQKINTYIYYDKRNYVTYHPKLFIFEGAKFTRIIIGSSNLTSSGLKSNLEASIQLDFRSKTDKQGINLINEIKDYYSDLLDLSSSKLELLTQEFLQKLIKDNLLFNQFGEKGKIKEPKNNDGENSDEKQKDIEITDFDIEDGFEQKHTTSTNRDNSKSFGKNDYEKFDTLIERYIVYKKNERPSGMVSKHTDDRELFYWYQKMHSLYNQGIKSFPFEIFERLLDADFPFDGIGRERKRLNKWNKDFKKIVDYKNKVDPKSEYTYVPQFKDKTNKYYKIGRWCADQKQRRKGNRNYGAIWTEFEEEKMESINFIWDSSSISSRPKDDSWTDSLVLLEEYYSKKKNYKSVPAQSTYIGHWLNDQMTSKLRQDRENRTDLISEIREEMLGNLLAKNGVEWEWEKQKHRESIEYKIDSWKLVEELKRTNKIKEFREKNPKILKKHRDNVAQLRSQSKKWNNDRNTWKYELLDKANFPYEKQ